MTTVQLVSVSMKDSPLNQQNYYKCQFCNRAFVRSEHRSRHERIQTNDRPFKCMECRKTFSRSDLLVRHGRTVHAKGGGANALSASLKLAIPTNTTETLKQIEASSDCVVDFVIAKAMAAMCDTGDGSSEERPGLVSTDGGATFTRPTIVYSPEAAWQLQWDAWKSHECLGGESSGLCIRNNEEWRAQQQMRNPNETQRRVHQGSRPHHPPASEDNFDWPPRQGLRHGQIRLRHVLQQEITRKTSLKKKRQPSTEYQARYNVEGEPKTQVDEIYMKKAGIFRWMKMNNYYPSQRKKPKWQELMSTLNISPWLKETLVNLVAYRFYRNFKEWGIVYVVAGTVEYHPLTIEWVSLDWNGDVETTRLSILQDASSRLTRLRLNSSRILRSAASIQVDQPG